MKQTPNYAPNYYVFETPEECAVAIREHREKEQALHTARIRAHDEMRQASGEHEFLVRCTEKARRESESLHHRMQALVARRACEIVDARSE